MSYNTSNRIYVRRKSLTSNTNSFLPIPSPCGLPITSVTSDNTYLYALQPDRKTIYKMDACARIICVFKTKRKYISIHYNPNGMFFAVAEGEKYKLYILNNCFEETGSIETNLPCNSCNSGTGSGCRSGCGCVSNRLFVGPFGCSTPDGLMTVADLYTAASVNPSGRTVSVLGEAGRNLYYTAAAQKDGILYEGLESRISSQTYIRATLLSNGMTKVQRLPYGIRVQSFFCYGGVVYAFITKNSYHAYIAAICVFENNGYLCGEILAIPESPYEDSCCEQSCALGGCHSKCTCSGGSTCSCVSTNNCNTDVGGAETENDDCDVEELCRIFNCLKRLCSKHNCSCGNGNCGNCGNCGGCGGNHTGCCGNCTDNDQQGCNGNLDCTCYPRCRCNPTQSGGATCLPLPGCNYNNNCCPPCENGTPEPTDLSGLRVTFTPDGTPCKAE